MPVAIVQDWVEEETERSTRNYDALSRRLAEQGGFPPPGLQVHTAGFTGNGFRIFEVWDSREHFDRFVAETLMPLVIEMEADDERPPQMTIYELHNVVTP
jgi:hypothetical protein